MSEMIGRECKFVVHIPANNNREDTHLIKERLYFDDGTSKPNLRVIENYKRPFYITKEPYRNHKQKKEHEELIKLNEFWSTQSSLTKEAAKRLGIISRNPSYRDITMSPYIYGTDIDSRVFIKHFYKQKWCNFNSPYTICVLDTESNIETNELIIASATTNENCYVAVLSSLVKNYRDPVKQLTYLKDKYLPKSPNTENIKVEFGIFETEIELIDNLFQRIHQWKPDFLTMWNMSYDISVMLDVCEKAGVEPKYIFSDPDLPDKLKEFKFTEDKVAKVTASGANKPPGPQERWHKVLCSSSFYWIDAMCAYNYVRVGSKTVSGGFGLNNILEKELGAKLKKLKFEDETEQSLIGADYHRYMVNNKPLEYVIYNIWDVMSIIELDAKTKDLSVSVPILSGDSSFDIFKSSPKKIVDALYFFYVNKGYILGTRNPNLQENEEISLSDWIVMLPVYRTQDIQLKCVNENDGMVTNAYSAVFDADQVSGYPSDSMALNVSRATMLREILSIGNIPQETYKLQNINLLFGPVNNVEYCTTLFNFPKLSEYR